MFPFFDPGVGLKHVLSAPGAGKVLPDTSEKKQRFDLLGTLSRNPSKPIRKRPHGTPNHIPRHPKNHEKVPPTPPKSDPKVTCASRESHPVPPDSESEGHPTGLFRHQNTASLRNLYASRIRCDCPRACRGFFRTKNSDFLLFRNKKSAFSCDLREPGIEPGTSGI